MKYSIFFISMVFLLTIGGCAREAISIDREHGLASNAAFDQQIVNKDYKHADKDVSGMDAIYAETTIGRYAETYNKAMTKEKVMLDNLEFKED